ncbi:ATP-binding protein [Eubacterium sp. MSJ-13]|uniref:AAA family ATPase n=1 Tax=Eubacterium sp. MSJ-13 TaxID=2841513 RepID=UPI001C0F44E6|nr:AAA family ATPase [Eubacterium sp. MSJ-13]MBU5479267.1 ATP-binding protein [Eubacterium sp. MSJ-13]
MGVYFNPSNASFKKDRNYKIYVDKTGLLDYLNELLETPRNCLAVSHARRFGKSHAAGMIDAYYSLGCDSTEIFDGTKISESTDYKKYMNKYNVIHLDIASVWDFHKEDLVESIKERVCNDFKGECGDTLDYDKDFYLLIYDIYKKTNIPFVIIIDEWDCVIRNSNDKELVHKYLQFLHSLFKSEESKPFLALAYITGILPIKKIKDESALNNFSEYTMLKSRPITKYYGFTENEVRELCKRFDMDFESTKAWYNGYLIDGIHMYNPNSVSMAMERSDFDSYWRNTSSFASINTFITMNYAGLKDDIMKMLAGGKVMINPNTFQNDFSTIASKDDALTALIHLGYLGYDADRKSAYVPNYEVATAFELALQTGEWSEIAKAISTCDELLFETIDGNADRVAELIELAHDTYTSILKYNDENSLSCVLTMAYFTAPGYYNIVREMPAGKGFADFVFIPRSNAGFRPAMVVELKYNKSADTAIRQIKENRYHGALSGYSDKILLVGISYDAEGKDKKHHTCVIEEINGIDTDIR